MKELNGKIAVVTGADSGIGKSIAVGLARSGAFVYLIGHDIHKLEIVTREVKTIAPYIKFYQADLSVISDINKLSRKIKNDPGKIDILVHSAGVISIGRFEDSSIKDLDRQYSINVRAPYHLTLNLLPLLKQSHGQIVFINSSVALRTANGGLAQYTMTKYALRALADSLREEINSAAIRVIAIYPGRTATSMQEKIHKWQGRKYKPDQLIQPEDVAQTVLNVLALPRTAEITDVSIRPFIKVTR